MKPAIGVWTRVHDDTVTMGVMQLPTGFFQVVIQDGALTTSIEDGQRRTMVDAYTRADAYLRMQGHLCSGGCGPWRRKL